jgi:hypothetical protein
MQTTLRLGVLGTLDGDGHIEAPDPDDVRFGDRKKGTHVGEAKGFSIHAGVVVGQGDFEGRERLARYCSRPAISLERLSLTKDGRIAYRIKRSSLSSGPTHRLMTPLEFMSRLAALLPPPRHPLIRFHGVLAAHAKWRPTVIPRPPAEPRSCASGRTGDTPNPGDATPSAARPKKRAKAQAPAREAVSPGTPKPVPPLPNDRGSRVRAATSRIDWAELLKRTYDVHALACPKCGGRLKFIAVITDAPVARAILKSMGERADRPVIARARAPTDSDGIDPPAAWDE